MPLLVGGGLEAPSDQESQEHGLEDCVEYPTPEDRLVEQTLARAVHIE